MLLLKLFVFVSIIRVHSQKTVLSELLRPIQQDTIAYCDNILAVYMYRNPVQHCWTKHIEIDIRFVCEKVTLGQVWVIHGPSSTQFVDIFTKGLAIAPFTNICSSLNVVEPHVDTVGVLYYYFL
jgi:hypothetical protein